MKRRGAQGKNNVRTHRSLTPAQLGRLGEAQFSVLCADVGLLAQRPSEDQNGWDFLLEFPATMDEGDDGVSQPRQAFVQVKTVWEGAKDVDLRLSAAARLGKSPYPSFLCILEVANGRAATRLHVLHLWTPLLDRVLTKLREMRAAGRATFVNKVDFRVPVPKARSALQPTGKDLLEAMEKAIGPDHVAYRAEKDNFLKNAGFPTRPVSGRMTCKISGPKDYQDFVLGLKELPLIDFEASTTRWGISIPTEWSSPPVSVRANPVAREVDVVFRRRGSLIPIRLTMMATLAPGPVATPNEDQWRLVHPNLEIRTTGSSFTMIVADPTVVLTTYQTLIRAHAIEELLRSEDAVSIEIHWNRKLLSGWRLETKLGRLEASASDALRELLRRLGVVLTAAGLQDAELPRGSWQSWQEDLHAICLLLEEPDSTSMSFGVDISESASIDVGERESLYVTALEIGNSYLACYATCRGRLDRDHEAGSTRFHLDNFEVRELRIVEKSDEAMHAFHAEARATTGLDTDLVRWGPTCDQVLTN